jgi:ABC-type branched-subunit amino acid transport system substrate-binding protein
MSSPARLALVCGVSFAGCACAGALTPGLSEDEVVLGISAPLSGPAAAWGTFSRGATAWAAHVNEGGGVNGRRVRVVVKDDGYVPGRALANLAELQETAFAIVGLLGTSVLAASRDLVAESGVPLVWPLGNPRLWAGQTSGKAARVFAAYPDYESEGAFLGGEAVGVGGARRVVAFYQNDDYGKEGLEGLRRGLARAGASLVAAVPYDVQERELSVHALEMRDSGADTAVLFATTTHGANLVREMAKVSYRPRLFASFPLGDHRVMFRLLGELWEGAYFDADIPLAGEEEADRVAATLVAIDPGLEGRESFAVNGAMAMMLAVEGLRRAGPRPTRASFVRALEGIRDWAPEGLGPPLRFGPERHHGANAVRLLRAGKAAEGSFVAVTAYQSFPPLF